ncbi:MAG TPA: hypothetical protein VG754_07015 [Verrucomicrobiae bacterium]|nr:hypothetical protein [Verrucomicrobiae bacterium]
MKLLLKILGRAGDFSDVQPLLALFLGGALLAVFLAVIFQSRAKPAESSSLLWTLYMKAGTFLWALFLVGFLVSGLSVLRSYLHQTVAKFQRSHGRVTEANYNAVQTIWGAEQSQDELHMDLYYEEEVTERIESEDLTKPAILRKKIVRHDVSANPFLSARHEVTLRQNPRKKGSALYGGYETACRFSWRLQNPADRQLNADIKFPLPAQGAVYNDLYATLNGKDILPLMEIKDGALNLPRIVKPGEQLDIKMGFKSRGMSSWYFQVKEPREIRDFMLTLTLPDLSKAHLNNPEGCMTPTDVKPTADGLGSVLSYRLDHAISSKGMGIALPTPPQPGEITNAVLGETEGSWLLIIALLVLGMTITSSRNAVLLSLLFGAATALGYGLLGDFSDLLFGFWGTAALVLAPAFILLAWFLRKLLPGINGKLMAGQLLLYGILLPCVAGLDSERQSLYLNICAGLFLAFAAWLLLKPRGTEPSAEMAAASA